MSYIKGNPKILTLQNLKRCLLECTRAEKFLKLISAVTLVIILLILLAPTEKSMGQGIKIVYIHVALIISGKIGILISGVLSALILFKENRPIHAFCRATLFVALCFFSAGIFMSIIAMKVNWGAIFWSEPRMKVSSAIIALALIIQILKGWYASPKFHAALNILLALFLLFLIKTTPLLMHPVDPVGESDSFAIRLTFISFITLFCALEALVIFSIHNRSLRR